MRFERWLVCLAAMACVGFSVFRDPTTLVPIRWPSSSVTMVVQEDGARGITDGTDILATRASLLTWGLPTCTSFQFVDGGLSPTSVSADDGVNRIMFTQNWSYGDNGVVALTEQRTTGSVPEQWHDADITVNEQWFTWATDGDLQSYDVQSVLTHELGHVLGLGHSPVVESTMYFGYSKGLTLGRTLHDDDRLGVCFIYPASSFACSSDAGCPLYSGEYYGGADVRMHCNAQSCVSGSVGYGESCLADSDCSSGVCFKGLDGAPATDPGFCSQSCILSPSGCPNGDYCHDDASGGGRGDVCHMGYVDCVDPSDCAGPSPPWYCVRDLDGRHRCLATCLQDVHCTAITGAVCHGAKSASMPGFCRVPGSGADGVPCQDGYECSSLYCTGTSTQPVCGRNAEPVDTGPAPDGSAPGDVGPGPDGGVDGDGRVVVDDTSTLVGGCACSIGPGPYQSAAQRSRGLGLTLLFVTGFLLRRRNFLRQSKTHRVD